AQVAHLVPVDVHRLTLVVRRLVRELVLPLPLQPERIARSRDLAAQRNDVAPGGHRGARGTPAEGQHRPDGDDRPDPVHFALPLVDLPFPGAAAIRLSPAQASVLPWVDVPKSKASTSDLVCCNCRATPGPLGA